MQRHKSAPKTQIQGEAKTLFHFTEFESFQSYDKQIKKSYAYWLEWLDFLDKTSLAGFEIVSLQAGNPIKF